MISTNNGYKSIRLNGVQLFRNIRQNKISKISSAPNLHTITFISLSEKYRNVNIMKTGNAKNCSNLQLPRKI